MPCTTVMPYNFSVKIEIVFCVGNHYEIRYRIGYFVLLTTVFCVTPSRL